MLFLCRFKLIEKMEDRQVILNHEQIQQKLRRIACQIYEDNISEKNIYIAGIVRSGYVMADKLRDIILESYPLKVNMLEVIIDKENPLHPTIKGIDNTALLKNKVVIIVDDVLNSGKTLIHSLRPFLEADAKKISTALLVDRDHKRYPVATDFVGLTLSTTKHEHIVADLKKGKKDVVYIS